MHPNAQLIQKFYTCFQQKDFAGMQACYHPNATFEDPAFGKLNAAQAKAMWQMLISSAKRLDVTFSGIEADDTQGRCHWEADYDFSRTGRKVHNVIEAKFKFKDGLILEHQDSFDVWRWSGQALGLSGKLLGWSPLIKNKIRQTATLNLAKFMQK
ncbi:Ketosteroid isomerase-related protein [Flexibacter flexilis DSM 6793]|uniref:Ketosteroid isomerase-related protein n=1 Tax=Flexibacter flexilis DSM 6793 TaxID=927664 RepID=A0A1I1FE19_9BACT|nr:nuclear transport factor 2 family protein [Flexibacter flexilis]SFB95383.1 Ketosteroid isomerase-related protein [Flexibacter flexilis DSM 6793]